MEYILIRDGNSRDDEGIGEHVAVHSSLCWVYIYIYIYIYIFFFGFVVWL